MTLKTQRKDCKNKFKDCLTLTDIFKDYKEKLKEKKTPQKSIYNVKREVFKGICTDFNSMVVEKILKEAYVFRMPHRAGNLRIKKEKQKLAYLPIDHKKSNELGVEVRHLNMHTNGYIYKWFWDKTTCILIGKRRYVFSATRFLRRDLGKELLKEFREVDYLE